MAKAITQINVQEKTEEERKKQIHQDMLDQIADNQESIRTTLDIIEELQQAGVLDMAKGLLRMREEIGSISIDKVNEPGMHHLIKNGFHAIAFIEKLDPKDIEQIMEGTVQGLDHLSKETEKGEPVGVWGLLKMMRDPHVMTALSAMGAFLHGFGEGMERKEESR
ncbi:DUF1641 domain-containing protein [Salibacterium sp. K-3]